MEPKSSEKHRVQSSAAPTDQGLTSVHNLHNTRHATAAAHTPQAAQDAAAAEAAAGPRSAMAAYAPAFGSGANPTSSAAASLFSLSLSEAAERSAPPPPVYGEDAAGTAFSDAAAATASGYTLPPPPTDAAVLRNWGSRSSAASTSGSTPDSASAAEQAAVARSSAANGGGATAVSPVEQLVSAWRFGISSDDDTEWAERCVRSQLSPSVADHPLRPATDRGLGKPLPPPIS